MSTDVLMQVPTTSVQGRYKLRVEGNVNGVLGGTAFVNETILEFSQRSMTIFIQTEKPLYMQGQTGTVACEVTLFVMLYNCHY